jgi:hypothetical protein
MQGGRRGSGGAGMGKQSGSRSRSKG